MPITCRCVWWWRATKWGQAKMAFERPVMSKCYTVQVGRYTLLPARALPMIVLMHALPYHESHEKERLENSWSFCSYFFLVSAAVVRRLYLQKPPSVDMDATPGALVLDQWPLDSVLQVKRRRHELQHTAIELVIKAQVAYGSAAPASSAGASPYE